MSDTLSKKYYTISYASKLLGVSKATLRRWEKDGKISSTTDESGIHLYSEESLNIHTHTPHESLQTDTSSGSPLTPSEVAKRTNISTATLSRWEKAGLIESTKTAGGSRRYNPADVAHLLSSRTPYQRIPKGQQIEQKVSRIYAPTPNTAPLRELPITPTDAMTFHRQVPLPDEQGSYKASPQTDKEDQETPVQDPEEHTSDASPSFAAFTDSGKAHNRFTKPLFFSGLLLLSLAGAGFLAVQIASVRGTTQAVPKAAAAITPPTAKTLAAKAPAPLTQGSVLGTNITKTTGAAGGTGAIGPTGIIGPTGGTGLSGLVGEPGPTGIMGFLGSSGATGPTGYAGFTGSQGVLGAVGATGGTGQIGAKGEVLFTQNNDIIFPYSVVDKSIALGSTVGVHMPTTNASNALIFLDGIDGSASISGLLTLRGGDSVIETQMMSKLTIGSSTTGAIQLSPNGANGLLVNEAGNVGIGTTPSYALDVKATGNSIIARFNSENATGCSLASDGTLSCTSDVRLKKNIDNISSGIDTLMALRPVSFDWKNLISPHKNLGFIAQEIESILPELVTTDTATGYKQLNMTGLIPVLTRALQQQEERIISLSNSLAQQTQETASIIARLTALIPDTRPLTFPLTGADEVKTNFLSPLSDTTQGIGLKLGDRQTLAIYNKEGIPTTSFDSLGNATLEGNLTADRITTNSIQIETASVTGTLSAEILKTNYLTASDASVSGTLYADRIITRFGELRAPLSGSNTPETAQSPTPIFPISLTPNDADSLISSTSALALLGANVSGDALENITIEKNIILTESLTAFGDTFLGNTTVGGSLTVGGTIHVSDDGIETYGNTLRIQSKKLASLDIMGGTIIVSNTGSVIINGNINIIGELATTEGISTSVLSPFGQDLTINLSKSLQTTSISASSEAQLAGEFGKLLIQGRGGYTVAAFDSLGNATLAGSLRTPELIANKVHMTLYPESSMSGTFTPSIGTAILPAGETSVTIANDSVTDESLVFITPTSPTGNTLYVVDKTPGEFIVGITAPPLEDIRFNWWIIN